jgi:hypothetical protein
MKLPAATGGDINSTDLPGRSFNEGRSLPAFPSSAVTPWRDGGRALFELLCGSPHYLILTETNKVQFQIQAYKLSIAKLSKQHYSSFKPRLTIKGRK